MYNKFASKHPWLTKKLKTCYWNLLKKFGISSFAFHLNEVDLKIKINPKDDNVGKFVYWDKYERETYLFISKFLRPGDKVVDVGANIGFFTLHFSKLVGDGGEVHSFEPSQREFLQLCENVHLNKLRNVFFNQLALSNQNGFSTMSILEDVRWGAFNSLGEITHRKVIKEKTFAETVRTIKLDDYILLFPELKPCLVKIDVEGFEKQTLEGMKKLLSNDDSPCLVVEVCEGTHQGENNSAYDLVCYLERFGYRLYSPNTVGNLIPFELGGTSLNCIALKPVHFYRLVDCNIG